MFKFFQNIARSFFNPPRANQAVGHASRARSPARQPVSVRPSLEALEDRCLMSVTLHGGAVMPNVSVVPVYYGADWRQSGGLFGLTKQSQQVDTFLKTITNSSYMDLLNQYGANRGQSFGAYYPSYSAQPQIGGTISDSQIQTMLTNEIGTPNSYSLPFPNANRLYVVYLPPVVESTSLITLNGTTSTWTSGFESNLQHYLGYHSSFTAFGTNVMYAVIPHPVANQDIPNLDAFQQMTEVTSHELAEAVTNPTGGGWYDSVQTLPNGKPNPTYTFEIGDIANLQYGNYQGYTVQKEWSNQANANVMPASRADLVGATFTFGIAGYPNFWAGQLVIQSENFDTGVFQGYFISMFGGFATVSGNVSNTTQDASGVVTSNISFQGAYYSPGMGLQTVYSSDTLTGPGNTHEAGFHDSMDGFLVDTAVGGFSVHGQDF